MADAHHPPPITLNMADAPQPPSPSPPITLNMADAPHPLLSLSTWLTPLTPTPSYHLEHG